MRLQRLRLTNTPMKTIDQQIESFVPQWTYLLASLIPEIRDDYRAADDDEQPGMCVTIGFTQETEDKDASWHYQTGDNSFTGGAYGHPHWAVVYLYRDSDPESLAGDAANEIAEACAW